MSEEHVEVVRELWDAYARSDFDHVLTLCDPHVVMVSLEDGTLYGEDAVRSNYERWIEAWDAPQMTVEEIFGAGDQVFVMARFRARGRASGASVDTRLYEVYSLRNRKLIRIDEFGDRAGALDAAGLQE